MMTLFALATPRCQHLPFFSALIVIGIPILTFQVAAPPRIGLIRLMTLLGRGAEAVLLQLFLLGSRRGTDAKRVREQHRQRVERAYFGSEAPTENPLAADPERLHHARRLAGLGTLFIVGAGLCLPLIYPNTFTYGSGCQAVAVILTDVFIFTVVGRTVMERFMIRLWESSFTIPTDSLAVRRIRSASLLLLGAALGSIAALMMVIAGAVACAIETSWFPIASHIHALEPVFWFIQRTAPLALPFGIMVGTVLGGGLAMAFIDDATDVD